MKEYKGLYHNTKDTTKTYEYGAHFKYSDLFNILKDLEEKQKENNSNEKENSNSLFKSENTEELGLFQKKRKKLKLKTLSNNKRYLITDINQENDEKNEIPIIEEEEENKRHDSRKKIRVLTKSLNKIHLPKISSNSLISLQNKAFNDLNESREIKKLNNSHDFKKKLNFPKIHSFHNNIIQEKENESTNPETKSIFQESGAVKIYDTFDKKKKGNQRNNNFPNLFHLSLETEDKNDIFDRPQRKKDRLVSIFEKEKKIKNSNNNLFLGDKNNYSNKSNREAMKNDMAQEIHNLKKQLLGNGNKSSKKVYY